MTASERAPLTIALPEFSGPLDLLLQLIQRRRLDVTAVSLAAVADQYLAQVLARENELEALSDFLVVASQLLLIKSRALLPAEPAAEPGEDPAAELRRQLGAFQVLQAAARWLAEREASGLRAWPRGAPLLFEPSAERLAPLPPARLAQLAQRWLVAAAPPPPVLDEVPRPRLVERAAAVLTWLDHRDWAPLAAVLGDDIPTAVATLLAVLVLVRLGALAVHQDDPDSPVLVRRLTDDAEVVRHIEGWS